MLSVNFSPFPVIETGRLLLRSLSYNDLAELNVLRTDERVLLHLNRDADKDMETTKAKMEEILLAQEKNDAVFWAITLKNDTAKMIGYVAYWNITKEHYRAEIGYVLHPDHWQKGIMKEVLKPVIKYAFEKMKLHSIEANINPANSASAALLESCGFIKEGYHKENYFHAGIFYDSVIYSRLDT